MKNDIKIIGIGGGANNVLSYFSLNSNKYNVETIASDSATCGMNKKGINRKLPLERVLPIYRVVESVLKGENNKLNDIQCCIGCEGNIKLGELSAKYKYNEIEETLKTASKVVLVASLGGGTGSGAIKVFLKIAKNLNIETTCLLILPFTLEGKYRKLKAAETIEFVKNSGVEYYEYCNDTACKKGENLIETFRKADVQASEFLCKIIDKKINK